MFGPILHVVRFRANDPHKLLDEIGSNGTGLTLPNYLRRFATEQVVAINTAASGGNASLFAVDE